jgi:hypothetical protein
VREWHFRGEIHREFGPAIIYSDGTGGIVREGLFFRRITRAESPYVWD